jgi:hypothetical protein
MSKTYYTTIGAVRGECGHRHRTSETAQRCADKDQAGCAHVGGYSDRRVVAFDAEGYEYAEAPTKMVRGCAGDASPRGYCGATDCYVCFPNEDYDNDDDGPDYEPEEEFRWVG